MHHEKMLPPVASCDLNPVLSSTLGKASGIDEVHHSKSVQSKQNKKQKHLLH